MEKRWYVSRLWGWCYKGEEKDRKTSPPRATVEDEEGEFWVLEGDICPSVSPPLFPPRTFSFPFFLDLGEWQFECKRGGEEGGGRAIHIVWQADTEKGPPTKFVREKSHTFVGHTIKNRLKTHHFYPNRTQIRAPCKSARFSSHFQKKKSRKNSSESNEKSNPRHYSTLQHYFRNFKSWQADWQLHFPQNRSVNLGHNTSKQRRRKGNTKNARERINVLVCVGKETKDFFLSKKEIIPFRSICQIEICWVESIP